MMRLRGYGDGIVAGVATAFIQAVMIESLDPRHPQADQ
jgi:hypothetical protein